MPGSIVTLNQSELNSQPIADQRAGKLDGSKVDPKTEHGVRSTQLVSSAKGQSP